MTEDKSGLRNHGLAASACEGGDEAAGFAHDFPAAQGRAEAVGQEAGKRWYVARTKPPSDEKAVRQLHLQGFEVFAPRLRLVRGRHEQRHPLFPGYVLVRLDLDVMGWQAVNNTRGVSRLLPDHLQRPIPLPVGYAERLIEREKTGGMVVVQDVDEFKRGDIVKIVLGPLDGIEGEVRGRDGDLIRVLISAFNRPQILRLNPSRLRGA